MCFLRSGPSKRLNIIKNTQYFKGFTILHIFEYFGTSSILPLKQGEFYKFSLRDPIFASLLTPFRLEIIKKHKEL